MMEQASGCFTIDYGWSDHLKEVCFAIPVIKNKVK